ncbi:MAG: biotin--[acetyl-CoA-carboxylase] ligase [Gemmatimonadota bacterium]|nr:biotin--[acetyl-CoA-carboxylase] ligase [Gemmatimonadota bacterium]
MSAHANPLPPSALLTVHEVVHLPTTSSTMDEAHQRAARGAPAGTLIVADQQTAGRGRSGSSWESDADHGVWFTLIERPTDASAVDVLSIRIGLTIASAVQALAVEPIQLKWPNDLFVGTRKLAGVLVEARWRERTVDWVAIGVGINLRVPRTNSAAGSLQSGTSRNDVLLRLIPALREMVAVPGSLSSAELVAWRARDLALDRRVLSPVAGTVRGLDSTGALRIEDHDGAMHELRSGSLVFAAEASITDSPC